MNHSDRTPEFYHMSLKAKLLWLAAMALFIGFLTMGLFGGAHGAGLGSSGSQGSSTPGNGTITNAILSTVPANTIKCNPTGSTAAPQDCTAANALTALGMNAGTVRLSGVKTGAKATAIGFVRITVTNFNGVGCLVNITTNVDGGVTGFAQDHHMVSLSGGQYNGGMVTTVLTSVAGEQSTSAGATLLATTTVDATTGAGFIDVRASVAVSGGSAAAVTNGIFNWDVACPAQTGTVTLTAL